MQLLPATDGSVVWLGQNLAASDKAALKAVRQNMQIVFQDPLASLDPRMTVGDIIAEPVRNFYPQLTRAEVKARVNVSELPEP